MTFKTRLIASHFLKAKVHTTDGTHHQCKLPLVSVIITAALLFVASSDVLARSDDSPQSSGTGFVVSREGHVLTNYHVVANCPSIRTFTNGTLRELAILGIDQKNDLALVKLPQPHVRVAQFRAGRTIRSGDSVVVVGFPLRGVLASEANVTTGTVSAMAGIGNDARFLQMTAPVQPGNSGGPALDKSGHVVGVVVSKLDALTIAMVTGDIPQNINFAIKDTVAKAFLESHGIRYEVASSKKHLEAAEIGEVAKQFTVFLECYSRTLDSGKRALEAARQALEREKQAVEQERQALRAEQKERDQNTQRIQQQDAIQRRAAKDQPQGDQPTGRASDKKQQASHETVLNEKGVTGSNEYLALVRQRITNVWSPPPVDLSNQDYVVIVQFRLHRNGRLTGVAIQQSSGNEYYDLAGIRAVNNAVPLPPFPADITDSYLDTQFTFRSPSGAKFTQPTDRGAPPPGIPAIRPDTAFNLAYNDYLNGNDELAVVGFKGFIRDFRESPLRPNAYYYLGESYYNLKDYGQVIQIFQQLLAEYPQSERIPGALYRLGLLFLENGDPQRSRETLKRLMDDFPLSDEAPLARHRLNEMRQ